MEGGVAAVVGEVKAGHDGTEGEGGVTGRERRSRGVISPRREVLVKDVSSLNSNTRQMVGLM